MSSSYKVHQSFGTAAYGDTDLVIGIHCKHYDKKYYFGCHEAVIFAELPIIATAMKSDLQEKDSNMFFIGADFAEFDGVVRLLNLVYEKFVIDCDVSSNCWAAVPVYRLAHMYGGETSTVFRLSSRLLELNVKYKGRDYHNKDPWQVIWLALQFDDHSLVAKVSAHCIDNADFYKHLMKDFYKSSSYSYQLARAKYPGQLVDFFAPINAHYSQKS